MKTMTMLVFLGAFAFACVAQNTEEKAVIKTVEAFAKAGDTNDVAALEKLLDDNYRIVMNRLFGSDAVAIVDRSGYISKIKTKEWGGDPREVSISSVTVSGNAASVYVTMKGTQATMISLLTLVKDSNGQWKLVSDVPRFG